MASTYTTNLGIEKIGTGDQSGTWGDTTNENFDIIDRAVNGVVVITASAAGSSGSPNALPITDGELTDAQNKYIEFTDGGDLGSDVFYQLTPQDAEKVVHIRNNLTTQDLVLFQGTYNASNDITVPNGKDMLVKFDGGGVSATATDVFNDLNVTALTAASVDINDGTIDNTDITVGAGKTLDVSAGTLTLADDQISGDKVSGGTIGTVTITALAGDLSLGDNNITNVGDIAVDSISADDTDMDITLTDNSGTALEIKEGSNTYLTFDSTNAAEKITLGKKLEAGAVEIEGSNFDIQGGTIGSTVTATTQSAGTSDTTVATTSFAATAADNAAVALAIALG